MAKIIRAIGTSLVSAFLLVSAGHAMAGTYDALCAVVECKIILDVKESSGPSPSGFRKVVTPLISTPGGLRI